MADARWLALAALVGCAPPAAAPPASAPPASSRRAFAPEIDGVPLTAGVAYGPHRDGQRPGGPDPSEAQIAEDLEIIARHWSMIRVYGSRAPTDTVLRVIAARELPLRVVLGAWIGGDTPAEDAAELDAAVALARQYPELVVAVSVGNETQVSWSAHRGPEEALVRALRDVRAAVDQPVTTADDQMYWREPESAAVGREVDFVFTHAHPLWTGQSLDGAIAWIDDTLGAIAAVHGEVPVIVGETGWATDVDPDGDELEHIRAPATDADQRAFYAAWAARPDDRPAFVFEAFDEAWKGGADPRHVEKHWGLYREDRTPKPAVDVLPVPRRAR